MGQYLRNPAQQSRHSRTGYRPRCGQRVGDPALDQRGDVISLRPRPRQRVDRGNGRDDPERGVDVQNVLDHRGVGSDQRVDDVIADPGFPVADVRRALGERVLDRNDHPPGPDHVHHRGQRPVMIPREPGRIGNENDPGPGQPPGVGQEPRQRLIISEHLGVGHNDDPRGTRFGRVLIDRRPDLRGGISARVQPNDIHHRVCPGAHNQPVNDRGDQDRGDPADPRNPR